MNAGEQVSELHTCLPHAQHSVKGTMAPHYYCYCVINKMRHKRTQENVLYRRKVLFSSVSPTHAGGLSWPCLLFVSCDNSVNIHNKDIFPFGKIIKSQERSRVPARHHTGCQGPG